MRTYVLLVFVLVLSSCSRHDQPMNSHRSSGSEVGALDRSVASANGIRDTVVEKDLFLGGTFPVGRMVWTVQVKQPNDSVLWSICAIVDGDTAFLHKGDSGWFKPTPSGSKGGQDTTSQKVPWYTHHFFEFERDSFAVDDLRRKVAQRFHPREMTGYLMDHGMTAAAAQQAEAAFWRYYSQLPIITFRFPEYPRGGDQRSFAYHPTIRWFLPVSMP
jgi:hypothetical protein